MKILNCLIISTLLSISAVAIGQEACPDCKPTNCPQWLSGTTCPLVKNWATMKIVDGQVEVPPYKGEDERTERKLWCVVSVAPTAAGKVTISARTKNRSIKLYGQQKITYIVSSPNEATLNMITDPILCKGRQEENCESEEECPREECTLYLNVSYATINPEVSPTKDANIFCAVAKKE